MALKCWHCFDYALQPDDVPQILDALTSNNIIQDIEWIAYTCASAYMTSNSGILEVYVVNAVVIGDGILHEITW